MDLNAILDSIVQFLSTDLGHFFGQLLRSIYEVLFPANAEAATDVPLPTPNIPGQ